MNAKLAYTRQTKSPATACPLLAPPVLACEVWQLDGRSRQTPGEARTRVVEMSRVRGLAPETVDDLAVIVSELTTNAVVHAPNDTICVIVMLAEREAHVVVIDHGRNGPPCPGSPADEHGRGLPLVEALADQLVRMPAEDGMAMWASVGSSPNPPSKSAT
ncbi:ATP-binding protein [Streptomyces sp. NPDC051987]|uniref:ATP-binding protein n=1 Tax=Streptomyces sp. NPDC051987 TaxID=3155808 RepID=UPI003447E4F6